GPALGLPQQRQPVRDQPLDIALGRQQPALAVGDDLGDTGVDGREHRQADRLGLDQHHRQPLLVAVGRGVAPQPKQVRGPAAPAPPAEGPPPEPPPPPPPAPAPGPAPRSGGAARRRRPAIARLRAPAGGRAPAPPAPQRAPSWARSWRP